MNGPCFLKNVCSDRSKFQGYTGLYGDGRQVEDFFFCHPDKISLHYTFFIGNSIFHLSLELLTKFWKMRLKVA